MMKLMGQKANGRRWVVGTLAVSLCTAAFSWTAVRAANPACVNGPQGPYPVGGIGPRTVTINCKELSLDPPGVDCVSAGAGQISGAGATLFVDFFRSATGYNDWIDVDVDTWQGSFGPFPGVDILSELWNPSININTHWMFQYRSVGSVNGYNEFVENQTCLAIPITIPSEAGLFNQFEYATTGVRTWGGPFDNNSGTPVEPCEIEFSFLDVPSKWATQVDGGAGVCVPGGQPCIDDLDCLPAGRCSVGPRWDVEPEGSGYGLNPVASSTGVLSNLQTLGRQCGICSVSGAPCARDSNCPAPQTCVLGGPVVSLNANTDSSCVVGQTGPCEVDDDCDVPGVCLCPGVDVVPCDTPLTGACIAGDVGQPCTIDADCYLEGDCASDGDADTIFDIPAAWVPVAAIANRGTGLRDVKYSQLQYLYVTGRMPNGENLIAGNRSVGSGTRNAHVNSLGIDTSWARGDNLGTENPAATAYNVGPNTQPTNCAGSSNMEAVIQSRRLSVGHTGLAGASRAAEDATAGSYEILNICKDVDTDGNPLCTCTPQACPAGPKVCARTTSIDCTANAALCNPVATNGACVFSTEAAPNNGYVRPTVNTVLDNADACCGFTIGGLGSFVTRGNPNANRNPADAEYQEGPMLDNQAVADYLNNIADSVRDFVAAGVISPRVCNFSEVCSVKRCSVSLVSCTGTGQGTCAAGNLCQFIPCDTVVPVGCPGGFGTCGLNANCLNDTDCADKGCSATNIDCAVDADCSDTCNCPDPDVVPCDTPGSGVCTQTGGACTDDIDCPNPAQTCLNDRCRTGNNMPGQFLATDFFLGSAIDAVQSLTDGMVFTAQALNQAAQNAARAASLTIVPAAGSVNSAGRVPTRNALAAPGHSDASTTGSYTYHNGTSYVTNFASGQRLACRNRIAGDFDKDCDRDVNDASELVKAQYTPRAWQLTAAANGAPAAFMAALPCDSGQQAPGGNQNAIPEIIGDFNGDGSLNKEDLRYFADGLAVVGGALDRKAGAIAIDNAILAIPQALPWNDPAQSLTVPTVLGTDPTHTAPIDVNDAGAPFLKTGKVYVAGDFRGDVAGAAGGPTAGAHPRGWDSVVDEKDIDYCCRMAQIGDWSNIDDAVYLDLSCDMDGDLDIDADDITELVEVILGTTGGDVDLDGDADDDDFAIVEATILAGAGGCNGDGSCGWADGDSTCDGIVDGGDHVFWPNDIVWDPTKSCITPGANPSKACTADAECGLCTLKICSGLPANTPCTGTGQGDCPAGQTCKFVDCITTADHCTPVGAGICAAGPAGSCVAWPNNSALATTRSLRFTVSGLPGTTKPEAIKVTMVDLQHPRPANLPAQAPTNMTTYDTRLNGTCVGGSLAGHHCDIDADCPSSTCGSLVACTADPACVDPLKCTLPSNSCARWVGKLGTFYEAQGPPVAGPYKAARLQCTPYYWDWKPEGLITVVGADIAPSSEYTVQVYGASCMGAEDGCTAVSPPVTMFTRRSGDVEQPFTPPGVTSQPDVTDIAQLVNKFKNLSGALGKSISQLQPNLLELNADINALDIVAVVDSVKGLKWAFSGPCACPSLVTCGALACPAGAGVCVTAHGSGSTCVKTCTGPGPLMGDSCINNTHCVGSGTCGAGFCRDRCGRCSP